MRAAAGYREDGVDAAPLASNQHCMRGPPRPGLYHVVSKFVRGCRRQPMAVVAMLLVLFLYCRCVVPTTNVRRHSKAFKSVHKQVKPKRDRKRDIVRDADGVPDTGPSGSLNLSEDDQSMTLVLPVRQRPRLARLVQAHMPYFCVDFACRLPR